MAKDDDDLLKQHGSDFDPSSDEEFRIPEDYTDDVGDGDDDGLMDFGDEHGHDDALAMDFDTESLSGDGDGGDSTHSDETPDGEEPDGRDEVKMGWKSYTGLALAALLVAGSLTYYVMPGDSAAPVNAQQDMDEAREIIRQRADAAIQKSKTGKAAALVAHQQRGAPVELQAFPVEQPNPISMNPQNQVTGTEIEAAAAAVTPMTDSNFPLVPMSVVPENRTSFNDNGRPSPMMLQGLPEFQALARLAQNNRTDIGGLQTEKVDQAGEIDSLGTRIEALEKKLELLMASNTSGEKPAKQLDTKAEPKVADEPKASKPKMTQNEEPVAYSAKVPKTPAEIKALQRQLAIYGYRPGVVDGVMGENTRSAVKRLQREHGMPETGWLSGETLLTLVKPRHYNGTYEPTRKVQFADHPRDEKQYTPTWFVRGVTPDKAVVYRLDGMSYAVSVGTEVPGMGQVTLLDPANHQVQTAHGTIKKRLDK
jgi:hypothetical protein